MDIDKVTDKRDASWNESLTNNTPVIMVFRDLSSIETSSNKTIVQTNQKVLHNLSLGSMKKLMLVLKDTVDSH